MVQVKYKDDNVKLESVKNNKCRIIIEYAAYYLDYEKIVDISEIKKIPKHKCNYNNFNHHCEICGIKTGEKNRLIHI